MIITVNNDNNIIIIVSISITITTITSTRVNILHTRNQHLRTHRGHSVAFPKGLSLVQWIFTEMFKWTSAAFSNGFHVL